MNDTKRTYEGMFVLPAGAGDFETVVEPVRRILARNEVEILALNPWDERRLAYEIRGHRRGVYALVYFKAETSRIREIEHDCQLEEHVLRLLIIRRDNLTQETIEAATPATASQRKAEAREREKAEAREREKAEAESKQASAESDRAEKSSETAPAETTSDNAEQASEKDAPPEPVAEGGSAETTSDNAEQASEEDAPPKTVAEGGSAEV